MSESATQSNASQSWFSIYHRTPLYLRIIAALILGLIVGVVFGSWSPVHDFLFRLFDMLPEPLSKFLKIVSDVSWLEHVSRIILRLLGALAPPLIFVAVVHVLMTSVIPRRQAGKLFLLLLLNTTVAILIGLFVANLIQPGKVAQKAIANQADVGAEEDAADKEAELRGKVKTPGELVVENIPRSVLGPFGDQANIIGVIILAVAFGIALRRAKEQALAKSIVELAYETLVTVLHWIIDIVPIGVFAVVAAVIGKEGFAPLKSLGAFIVTVVIALLLQATWYLLRIKLFSWASPLLVLRGMRDALFMAFSTDSSTATMPVTYACLKDKVGVREQSASLGGLVGANFNNDGTALYEATAALFIAQLVGKDLSMYEQLIVVLTSIIASVGAAGIPEAGLVTMTVVFTAVGLPLDKIAMLLTVDWFLDRCRTTINVLGDVNVSLMLDGRVPESAETHSAEQNTKILPVEPTDGIEFNDQVP